MDKAKIIFAASVVGVAALHFVISFFVGFAAGISPPGNPFRLASQILSFPLAQIQSKNDPGIFGWILWIGISLVWGFAICFLVRSLARR